MLLLGAKLVKARGAPRAHYVQSLSGVSVGPTSLGVYHAAVVRIFRDYRGAEIRLTDERLTHICEHPEMVPLQEGIGEALSLPDCVMTSVADPDARLYYRLYRATSVGDKYLCVVVKASDGGGFVLTAYLTDRIKRGVRLWPATE